MKCDWLFKVGYQCGETADWQIPCLMENGELKTWKLCHAHQKEAGPMLKLLVPEVNPQWQQIEHGRKGSK